jgi:hypothetical protein
VVRQRRGDLLSVLTVDPVEGRGDPLVRRTAETLRVAPAPMIAEVIVWVVEIGAW